MPSPEDEVLDRRSRTRIQRDLEGTPKLETVRVVLLGGFTVRVGSRAIQEGEWHLKKAANLIKLLALAEEHRLHRDRVTDLLWPDLGHRAAANNLYHVLYVARRLLEKEVAVSSYLRLRDEWLELCPDSSLWVDVEAFEEAASRARRARSPSAYRATVELYAGELLPGDPYEGWAEERRAQLRTLHLALLVEMARLYEEHAEREAATEALVKVVADEPGHEEARVGLMRLYAASGRRQEALMQYEKLGEALAELGEEPLPTSQRFHKEIKAGKSTPESPPSAHPSPEEPQEPLASRQGLQGSQHNLPPQKTSFVGREWELTEVKRALATTRLLTLTGVGGCGKTRLALEVARDLMDLYPNGVWLVELAPLSEEALVPQAVAGILGVRVKSQTVRSLTRSRTPCATKRCSWYSTTVSI